MKGGMWQQRSAYYQSAIWSSCSVIEDQKSFIRTHRIAGRGNRSKSWPWDVSSFNSSGVGGIRSMFVPDQCLRGLQYFITSWWFAKCLHQHEIRLCEVNVSERKMHGLVARVAPLDTESLRLPRLCWGHRVYLRLWISNRGKLTRT